MQDATVEQRAHTKLVRRLQILLVVIGLASAAYAASWTPHSATSAVAASLGPQADNVVMLLVFLPLPFFLAMLFPNELDTPEARKYIGPLVVLSDISGVYVCFSVVRAYTADRSKAARDNFNLRMCLYIHYAVCAFFFFWGVVYPTLCFLRIGGCRNSWAVLRRGLVIDASAFYVAIGLLCCFEETRFPPGDAPLAVALFGRPAIGLLTAAIFTPQTRKRIRALGVAAGLFHVSLGLNELQRDEIRSVLGRSGYGAPIASGNLESSLPGVGLESSTGVESQYGPRSHHTVKVDGVMAEEIRPFVEEPRREERPKNE